MLTNVCDLARPSNTGLVETVYDVPGHGCERIVHNRLRQSNRWGRYGSAIMFLQHGGHR